MALSKEERLRLADIDPQLSEVRTFIDSDGLC